MSTPVLSDRDHSGVARILNLPNAVSDGEPATLSQVNALVEGLAWKDSARVATQGNINLASPGATIDGVTMATGDRVLVRSQTAAAENGLYVWNGTSSAMVRAPDGSTAAELEQAVVTVEEGTSAGATYRQTAVNFTLGSGAVAWTTFGTAAGAASESTAGIAEIATQGEMDAGTDDLRFVTSLKVKSASWMLRKHAATIGDGSATQYTVTHNFGTKDIQIKVYRNSDGVEVITDITLGTVNAATIGFATAPTSNQYRVVVVG